MNKLKKLLFGLAAIALPVLVAAPAMAGVVFGTAGGSRIVRAEGVTEVVSGVSLSVDQAGTIVTGTSINIKYDGIITNTPTSANVVCQIASTPNVGGLCDPAFFAVSFLLDTFAITFLQNVAFVVTDSISVGGVRVNAAAVGAGVTQLNAGVSSVGDPISNLVTYNPTTVPVATPLASLKGKVPVLGPLGVLTCAPPSKTGGTNFSVSATENFKSALATAAQETTFSTTPAATVPTQVDVILTGVPAGFTITPVSAVGTGTMVFAAVPAGSAVTQGASEGAITFSFPVTATDLATADTGTFSFNIGTTLGAPIASGGTTGPVTAKIRIGAVATTGILRFVDSTAASGTVVNIADCVTRLLYSWIVNTAGYDTGIAIANTTLDNVAYEPSSLDIASAVAQNGPCVLTGYPAGGGTPISFTTASIPAGQTIAFTISGVTGFSGFSGYVLTVCNFLNAHSFAFISNGFGSAAGPTLAQGYQALVVPAGTRVIPGGETLGQ